MEQAPAAIGRPRGPGFSAFAEILLWLAERGAPATLVQVARAMGQLRSPRFLPVLLELLAQREVRADARTALVAYGPEGLAFLDGALGDASLPVELRRHVPRTIALFAGSQRHTR